MTALQKLQIDFNNLTDREKQNFITGILAQTTGQLEIIKIKSEINQINKKHCPHCKSHSIVANGKNKGIQRYKCNNCGKNYSENTGTSLAHLKKAHLWKTYISHMFEGKSIAKCAKLTGISIQTSFNWRHKILSSLQSLSPEKFEGISESDDIFFNYSEKGCKSLTRKPRKRGNDGIKQGISEDKVAVILTCDRKSHKDIKVAKRGRISKADIENVLSDKLDKESVLCTDSHRSYSAFTKAHNIKHEKIHARKKQYVKDKIYHVQNANQTARALKDWMTGFNGVATKYLQNYLSWYMVLDQIKNKTNKPKEFAVAALISTDAWFLFKNIALNHI
ncbi:MAG: IS1595 family transposase [Bacteroidales bacterium]|nr:IS1595 family transposase [Bacteroidales bacterium]